MPERILCMKLRHCTRAYQFVIAFFWLSVLAVFKYWHATRGIDLTDEGMWLSTSMRYALGDIPFRDEIENTSRPFDALVSVVFRMHPTVTLLQMRCLGLAVELLGLLGVFLFVARYASPLFVAFLCTTASLLHDQHGIMSPSYNLLSQMFGVCGLIIWMSACITRNRAIRATAPVLSGISIVLCVTTYLPMALLLWVPLLAVVLEVFRTDDCHRPFLRPTLLMLGTFVVCTLGLTAAMSASGMWEDFHVGLSVVAGAKTTFMDGESRPGQNDVVLGMVNFLTTTAEFFVLKYLPILRDLGVVETLFAFVIGATFAVSAWLASRARRFLPLVLIALLAYSLIPLPIKLKLLLYAAVLGILGFLPVTKVESGSSSSDSWNDVRRYMLLWGFSMALVYLVASGSTVAVRSIVILVVVGMAALMRVTWCTQGGVRRVNQTKVWVAVLWAGIVPFFMVGIDYNGQKAIYTSVDDSTEELTAEFVSPRLKGIRSTPAKVALLDGLLSHLESSLQPGDYLLAYPGLPLLHFLTSTRPATNVTWINPRWPIEYHEKLVDYMVRNERVPEICVIIRAESRPDWDIGIPLEFSHLPIDQFVRNHFYLDRVFAPFEVWRRASSSL